MRALSYSQALVREFPCDEISSEIIIYCSGIGAYLYSSFEASRRASFAGREGAKFSRAFLCYSLSATPLVTHQLGAASFIEGASAGASPQ